MPFSRSCNTHSPEKRHFPLFFWEDPEIRLKKKKAVLVLIRISFFYFISSEKSAERMKIYTRYVEYL